MSVDEEILEVIRERPGDWKIKILGRLWSRDEILTEYPKNEQLRKELRKLLMGLKLHELSRRQ